MSTREEIALTIATQAETLWHGLDKNERTGVRFGMFPYAKMLKAENEIHNAHPEARDLPRLLSVALMDCAQRNGGMRA